MFNQSAFVCSFAASCAHLRQLAARRLNSSEVMLDPIGCLPPVNAVFVKYFEKST
jgi:hypothetical protein